MIQPVLEARQLSVVLGGQKILDIPSMGVLPGEVLVIIGPNGSGKTTLLLSLALLLKPASGGIYYRGQDVYSTGSIVQSRRRFAVVFQESMLLNGSVRDNITLGLKMRGVNKEDIRSRTDKWLERFGVLELSGRQAKTLSGGEAKRVSLARAFVLQPEVLFLDEPFTALDSPTRQTLIEDFDSVLRETKVTTIMVTHERNEAIMLASRVAVVIKGKIRQIGATEEIFSHPIDEEVGNFVEAGNILHGTVALQEGGIARVKVSGQTIDVVSQISSGTDVTVFLHNEDITVSLPTAQVTMSSARNQLTGTISKIYPAGSQIRLTIDCGFPLVSLITKRSYEELGLGIGKTVVCSFKASAVHVIKRNDSQSPKT